MLSHLPKPDSPTATEIILEKKCPNSFHELKHNIDC